MESERGRELLEMERVGEGETVDEERADGEKELREGEGLREGGERKRADQKVMKRQRDSVEKESGRELLE